MESRAALAGQVGRFLVVGVANTLLTGALFLALTLVLPVWLAYSLAFAAGILFVVLVAPRLVFAARPTLAGRAVFGTWYLLVYLVGLGCVEVLDEIVRLEHVATVIITLGCTSTCSFVGGRVIFSRRPKGDAS